MSHRLYVGKWGSNRPNRYDCVIDSIVDARENIKDGFLFHGSYRKLIVGNKALFKKLQPVFFEVFDYYGWKYPECISCFYYKDSSIEYPSESEFEQWLIGNNI